MTKSDKAVMRQALDALGLYLTAGHGNGTDFAKQSVAYDKAIESIAALGAAIAQPEQKARDLIEECRLALAEELAGWDIDPPLQHVKQAHDKCVAWLLPASGMVYCAACEQNVSGPCNSMECSTPETFAQPEQQTLSKTTIKKLHKFLDASAGDGVISGGVDAADLYIEIFPENYAAGAI